MNKINQNELEKIINEISFYNFNVLNANDNNKIVVKFHKNIAPTTYSDLQFYDGREKFDYKWNILVEFINKILANINEEECIVRKYNKNWIINPEGSKKLSDILRSNAIKNNFNGGLLVNKHNELINLFIESVLKYNSFIQLIFRKSQFIISPTDHMDIFFESNNMNKFKRVIYDNINAYVNILVLDIKSGTIDMRLHM